MRVVDSMRYQSATRQLASLRSQHAGASERALTGRRIAAPSDDPLGAAELVQLRSRAEQVAAQRSTITSVQGDAELAEGMLAEAGTILQRIHELAMQGANDAAGNGGRQAIAEEVNGLRDQLLKIANTKGSNGYVFGGTETATPPFDDAGNFFGNDQAHRVDIGTSSPVRVNASGQQAFTAAGGRDVFGDVSALLAALNADDGASVRATLSNLQAGHDQLQTERGRAGILLNRLDLSTTALDHSELLIAQQDEAIGAADPIQAYSDFVNLGQALERAIGVSQKLLSMGSLNQF